MGEVGSVGCVGFLVDRTGACVLVGGAGYCVSGGHRHIWLCVWGVCELNIILGSISANGWGSVPLLLIVWPGGVQC